MSVSASLLPETRRPDPETVLIGLRLLVSRAFGGGLTVSFGAGADVRRYAGTDPLFGRKQVDRGLRLNVRVLHRSLRYKGFAPYVGFSVERNRSNIQVHEYRSRGVAFGVSRTF